MTAQPSASFALSGDELDSVLQAWASRLDVWAPRRLPGRGRLVGQDVIRYGPVTSSGQIEWQAKSDFPPKEVLFPPNETLFHLLGDQVLEPESDDRGRPLLLLCWRHPLFWERDRRDERDPRDCGADDSPAAAQGMASAFGHVTYPMEEYGFLTMPTGTPIVPRSTKGTRPLPASA